VSEVVVKHCAMPRSVRSNDSHGRYRAQVFPGDPCSWPASKSHEGVALCWVHYRAVVDGTRDLSEARRKRAKKK